MPEVVLSSIPPLEITPDNSSEADNASSSDTRRSTNRSSTSSDIQQEVGLLLKTPKNGRASTGPQVKNKSRKSNTTKRLSKKAGGNVGSQSRKCVNKSQIPRSLLLTPSSSSKSLNSAAASYRSSSSQEVGLNKSITTTTEQTITTTVLERQKTGIILAYRERKSISQMDMKYFNRSPNKNYSSPRDVGGGLHPKSLMMKCNGDGENNNKGVCYSSNNEGSSIVHKLYGYQFNQNNTQLESQMAGLRIFSIIMLNAWRKRRQEVKRLLEEVGELKRSSIKARNQLHVFNSLFRMEQKRNDELSCQLKHSLEDITNAKSSCEILTTSLMSLRADKQLLEEQNHVKDQEIEELNNFISELNSKLFRVMAEQRDQQANFSIEQRKIQALENEKNELLDKIYKLNNEISELESKLDAKTEDLYEAFKQLDEIKGINYCNEQFLTMAKAREEQLNNEIEKLQTQIDNLETCCKQSMGYRLKNVFYKSLIYPKMTLHILHWFIYYLLPATPPPKPNTFPFGFAIAKFLNIVKC
ncbi:uncharacterized protein [Musca autumnalis]|uniref:uncharacterized protein n=1 Tax=Musca autumnalis TaxID=221902 RepID=UPI003CF568DB